MLRCICLRLFGYAFTGCGTGDDHSYELSVKAFQHAQPPQTTCLLHKQIKATIVMCHMPWTGLDICFVGFFPFAQNQGFTSYR